MPPPHFSNTSDRDCLRYWDLADSLKIGDVVALWCGAEPSVLRELDFSTTCMDAKRAAIEDALNAGRLEYIDEGVPFDHGKIWKGAEVSELIEKNRLRIRKVSLRRWFEDMAIDDRPGFLFEDERSRKELPDGSDIMEMNSNLAIAIMAELLAESAGKYKHGKRTNTSQIGEAIRERAAEHFGEEKHGLKAFNKKITKALEILKEGKRKL